MTVKTDSCFLALNRARLRYFPVIACLYTGKTSPPNCEPMPRSPMPPLGAGINADLSRCIATAWELNPAVHDGAIMIGREKKDLDYRVKGWSYRLYPPPSAYDAEPNRGSAFNSCLAMSAQPRVDCLYLISGGVVTRFEGGYAIEINNLD